MMISRDITVDGITYTVSATTLRGLDEAIQYLEDSLKRDRDRQADQLELELNQAFDEVLEKIETGEIQLPEEEHTDVTEERFFAGANKESVVEEIIGGEGIPNQVDQPDQESEVKPAEPAKPKLSARKKKND